jgi:hypothetical protein
MDRPISDLVDDIRHLPWDSEQPVVQMSRVDALSVMHRYDAGELSNMDIEEWANTIEGRDDIGLESHPELRDFIFQLANPILTQPLTSETARTWIERFNE